MTLPAIKDDTEEYGARNEAIWCDDGWHERGKLPIIPPLHFPGSMGEEWEVKDVRSNSTGTYYALNVLTKGVHPGIVTVKHSTRFDTFVCLTHLGADRCAHSRFVRKYVTAHPLPTEP